MGSGLDAGSLSAMLASFLYVILSLAGTTFISGMPTTVRFMATCGYCTDPAFWCSCKNENSVVLNSFFGDILMRLKRRSTDSFWRKIVGSSVCSRPYLFYNSYLDLTERPPETTCTRSHVHARTQRRVCVPREQNV